MRLAIWLLTLLSLSSVVSAQDAFCVKYSKALFGASTKASNYALLNAVVARVTVGCNNDLAQAFGVQGLAANSPYAAYAPQACGNNGVTVVPGLVSDPLNAPFFAGTAPFFASATNAAKLNAFANPPVPTAAGKSIPFVGVNATTRAVTPFAATLGGNIASPTVPAGVFSEGLITHLITFFGAALGCDMIDLTKDTVIQPAASTFIGRYNGVVNMTLVHQGMAINNAVWNEFANTFVLALKSFGVTQADIDGTIVPYVSQFLRGPAGTSNVICNQADCPCAPQFVAVNGQCVVPAPTFCQKYAKALYGASTTNTQYALLNAVVARVTIGCNNNLAQAFGVQGLPAGSPYAVYAAQQCGNNGLTVVPGLVSDPLNAPFFAGTAPFFTSVTNAAQLNAFPTPPVLTAAGKSIPFVSVNVTTRAVTPLPATLGGMIATGNFQEGLITHLISFFGRDLGCDIVPGQNTMIAPTNKAFIGKYNGSPNMTAVHAGMGINLAVWNEFAATFVGALKSFGVTQADIDGTIVPYVSKFLRGPAGTDNVICNGADCPCAPQFNTVTVGGTTQCVVPPPDTFCQKYSKALFGVSTRATNYQLLNAVVARVTVGCNNNLAQAFGVQGLAANSPFAAYAPQQCGNNGVTMVPGLVQDTLNAPFFAGTAPAYTSVTKLGELNVKSPPPAVAGTTFPSIRFVGVNARAVTPYAATTGLNTTGVFSEGLIQHLIAFFGRDLGCDVDTTQNTLQSGANPFIGKYNGAMSMTAVHQGMAINQFVWDEFVNTFVQALLSFGVKQADIDGTVKPYLAQFLNGPANSNNVICNQPGCMCAAPFVKDATGNCVTPTAPTVAPTIAPAKPTFCGKYAAALFPTATPAVAEYKLLQAVIARVILGCDNNLATAFGVAGVAGNADYAAFQASACGNVAGFSKVLGLVSDPLNAPFFDGTAPNYFSVTQALALNLANNVSQTIFPNPRFVTPNGFSITAHPAALGGTLPFDPNFGLPASMRMSVEGLITHLIAFFGRDLGCQSIDVNQNTKVTPITDARIGKYNGATSMFQVHAGMKITQAVWNEFATTFIGALKSFGVTQADIDQTIVPYVSQFLRGPTNMADMMICNQPDCACAPQFVLAANGQCVDPKNQNPNVGANGQTGKVGSATTTWASPIIVMVVSIMTYLLA